MHSFPPLSHNRWWCHPLDSGRRRPPPLPSHTTSLCFQQPQHLRGDGLDDGRADGVADLAVKVRRRVRIVRRRDGERVREPCSQQRV